MMGMFHVDINTPSGAGHSFV